LPFLIVGLGVDDMYIISLSAVDVPVGCSFDDYIERFRIAYTSISSPVSMTSFVNCGMFAMLLTSTIPAVFKTAWTAIFAIILLYLTMMTSLAALVALDMQRQMYGRADVACCAKVEQEQTPDPNASMAYISTHTPEVALEDQTGMWAALKRGYIRVLQSLPAHIVIIVFTLALIVFSAVGIKNVPIGLDLEDFFPPNSVGGRFTEHRMKYFPVWPIQMNWKKIDYTDGSVQMKMVHEFERVLGTKYVLDTVDSDYVWTANLAYWAINASYDLGNCDSNDVVYEGNCGPALDSRCSATWMENTYDLKLASNGGYCYTAAEIGKSSSTTQYCPVLDGLSDDDFAYCVSLWYNRTSAASLISPKFNTEDDEITPKMPIKFSQAAGSVFFAYNLDKTEDYVGLISSTRDKCKSNCFMSGIPYDYYEQYVGIRVWLVILVLYALAAGFLISSAFIFGEVLLDERYDNQSLGKKLLVSYVGAIMITLIALLSIFCVVGVSSWLRVKLCGFSAMSYLMSVGFAVEYSVHVTHRFLTAPRTSNTAADRIAFALDLLSRPMFMAFTSSAVGVFCLLFSTFVFVRVYFFIPLVVVLVVTYYYGVIFLPVLLQYTFCDCLDLHAGEHDGMVEADAIADEKL